MVHQVHLKWFNRLICKSLAGAPTVQIEHLMVHQRLLMVHQGSAEGLLAQMKPRFLDKFSREFDNKSALYGIISMTYWNKSMSYWNKSMSYWNKSLR